MRFQSFFITKSRKIVYFLFLLLSSLTFVNTSLLNYNIILARIIDKTKI